MKTEPTEAIKNLDKEIFDEIDSFTHDEIMNTINIAFQEGQFNPNIEQLEWIEDYGYIKEQIREGYISENGTPLKCWCGCTDFKQVKQYYCEHGIEEYSLQCTNIDCLKIVGHWAFGNWQI